MRKIFFAFIATALLSVSANAVSPDSVDFSKIQMDEMKLINEEGQDALGFKMKLAKAIPADTLKLLEQKSHSKILSPIYVLAERSTFKNIYAFIGLTDEGFQFIYILHNSKGGYFTVGMTIVNVKKSQLDLTHGPSDQISKYTLISPTGDLFP